MNHIVSEVTERKYWSVKDLSIHFNTTSQKINYYCNSFGIPPMLGKRPKVFNREAFYKISKIILYIHEGYKLRAIKNKL